MSLERLSVRSFALLSWLIPLLIALLFLLPIGGIPVSPDGAYYAGQAQNLLNGEGLTYMDGQAVFHRPLFPIILSIAYAFFGATPLVSYFVVKAFALANILLVSALARSLFGTGAALIAGLLVATSYRFNEWSGWLNLDFVLPTFLLLFFLAIFNGLAPASPEKRHLVWLAVGGVALGTACLVKELALLFLPLPLLSGLMLLLFQRGADSESLGTNRADADAAGEDPLEGRARYRWASIWRQSGWVYLVLLLTLLPGGVYAAIRIGTPSSIFGATFQWGSAILLSVFGSGPGEAGLYNGLLSGLSRLLLAPVYYFGWQLMAHFIVAPLFIVASLYHIVTAWRGNRSSLFFVGCVSLFLPMILLQGIAGFRERQGLILMYLMMIGLAGLLAAIYRWIRSHLSPPRLSAVVAPLPLLFVIFLQGSWDMAGNVPLLFKQMNTLAADSQSLGLLPIRSPQPWWPTERTIGASRQIAAWLDEQNSTDGKRFLASEVDARYINFLTDGKHHFYALEGASLALKADSSPNDSDKGAVLMQVRSPNALLSWRADRSQSLSFYGIQFYSEQSLLGRIQQKQIDYVAVGNQNAWLAAYFLLHPDFRHIGEFEYGTIYLFAVLSHQLEPISPPPIIDENLYTLLSDIEEMDPARYDKLMIYPIFQQLVATTTNAKGIADPNSPAHPSINNSTFNYGSFARWVVSQEDLSGADLLSATSGANSANDLALKGALLAADPQRSPQQRVDAAAASYSQAFAVEPLHYQTAVLVLQLLSTFEDVDVEPILVEQALNVYDEYVRRSPGNAFAYMQLASAHMQAGEVDTAIAVYDRAIKNDAATAELYLAYVDVAQEVLAPDVVMEILQRGLAITRWDDPAYARLKEQLAIAQLR